MVRKGRREALVVVGGEEGEVVRPAWLALVSHLRRAGCDVATVGGQRTHSWLRARAALSLEEACARATATLVVAASLDGEAAALLRALRERGERPAVLVLRGATATLFGYGCVAAGSGPVGPDALVQLALSAADDAAALSEQEGAGEGRLLARLSVCAADAPAPARFVAQTSSGWAARLRRRVRRSVSRLVGTTRVVGVLAYDGVDDSSLSAALDCWAAVPGVKAVPLVLPASAARGSSEGAVRTAAGITLVARSLAHFLRFSGSAGSLFCLVLPASLLSAALAQKVTKAAAQELSASLWGGSVPVVDQTSEEPGGVAQQLGAIEQALSLNAAQLALESLNKSCVRAKEAVHPVQQSAEQPQHEPRPRTSKQR